MRAERSTIAGHALTVLAGQLAVMAFGVTDTVVAGRHAPESLAALSIGSAIFISVYVALMGMVQALLPLWAEQRGNGKPAALGASFRQALYLCIAASALGMAVLLSPGKLLEWTDVPVALRQEVSRYLAVLALALPPALLFRMYSTLCQALGRPQLVTWLQVAALLVKLPLSVWLTFGGMGVPAMGAVGCAWATLAVNFTLLALALVLLRKLDIYAPLRLWQRLERPDWALIGSFARLGVPAGLAITVEVTSFTLMALFIARQGTLASAGHQIAANVGAVAYMVPLSLAIATSARVSFWRGSGNETMARAATFIGFRLAVLASIALAAIILIAFSLPVAAQMNPVGHWQTVDEKTQQPKSQVRITESGGVLTGTVEKLLRRQAKQDAVCTECTDDRKGAPLLGMEIIRGAQKAEGKEVWEGGKILDPENGKTYALRLTPADGGQKLDVRGSIGPFGRTQTWTRVQ